MTYAWSVTQAPNGAPTVTFSPNGSHAASSALATLGMAGTYTFAVTATDANGLTATSSVQVNVTQADSAIQITPGQLTLAVGTQQQFQVVARDQFGNLLTAAPAITW